MKEVYSPYCTGRFASLAYPILWGTTTAPTVIPRTVKLAGAGTRVHKVTYLQPNLPETIERYSVGSILRRATTSRSIVRPAVWRECHRLTIPEQSDLCREVGPFYCVDWEDLASQAPS